LQLDFGAAVFELLLEGLGLVLGDVLLDGLGGAFDQILGLLEAQAGDLADHLDDVDLLRGVEARQDDRELGLLGRLLRGRAARTAHGAGHDHTAAGGLDLVNLFEVIAQLDGARDGQRRDLVAQVLDLRTPGPSIAFSHYSGPFLDAVLPEAGQWVRNSLTWFDNTVTQGRRRVRPGRRLRPCP